MGNWRSALSVKSALKRSIALLILFGICWTFVFSLRSYIGWKYILAVEGKYERFGITEMTFSNQSDIKFEKKTYLRGMTGNDLPSPPGRRENSRRQVSSVVLCTWAGACKVV